MKTRTIVLLAVLGLMAAAAVPAFGQSVRLNGTIPFAFMAGDQAMPAGNYTLTNPAGLPNGWWVITGPNQQAGTFVVAGFGGKKGAESKPRLVFRRYGERFFLAQIWSPANEHVYQVRRSRTERAAAEEAAAMGLTTIAMR